MSKVLKRHDPSYDSFVNVENDNHYVITPAEGLDIECPFDIKMKVGKHDGKIIIKRGGIMTNMSKVMKAKD